MCDEDRRNCEVRLLLEDAGREPQARVATALEAGRELPGELRRVGIAKDRHEWLAQSPHRVADQSRIVGDPVACADPRSELLRQEVEERVCANPIFALPLRVPAWQRCPESPAYRDFCDWQSSDTRPWKARSLPMLVTDTAYGSAPLGGSETE